LSSSRHFVAEIKGFGSLGAFSRGSRLGYKTGNNIVKYLKLKPILLDLPGLLVQKL
jgi:hypothetical protein